VADVLIVVACPFLARFRRATMTVGMVLLAITLGLDVFAGGLALGVNGLERSRWARTALVFALLTLLLLSLGLGLGRLLDESLGNRAAYIAGTALILFGLRAAAEAFQRGHDHPDVTDSLGPRAVLTTGVMVNLDKLAVGVSLAFVERSLGLLIAYVTVQAYVATLLGLVLGKRMGAKAGETAAVAAGLIFVVLGAAIIYQTATDGKVI
jgi:putative Mn2+ efflux pump MntP